MWLIGRKLIDVSSSLSIVRRWRCISMHELKHEWGSTAPLGSPVVPEV